MSYVVRNVSNNVRDTISVYRDDGSEQYISREESIYMSESVPVDDNTCLLDVMFNITKAADEGLVSGWASIAVQPDGSRPLDWDDDVIRTEVLEKAAINFMMDYRGSGVKHEGEAKGVVVESIVFTKEKQAAIGIPEGTVPEGWFITVKVFDDEVFSLVKSGTYKMFSIQGKAKRVAV